MRVLCFLLKHIKLFCFFPLLLICSPIFGTEALPKEVSTFLEQRESCDHWRGEYGDDKKRQDDIDWFICQACWGTDAKLAKLKHQYKNQQNILSKLNEFESEIESKDKAAVRRFCKGTRQPEWYDDIHHLSH